MIVIKQAYKAVNVFTGIFPGKAIISSNEPQPRSRISFPKLVDKNNCPLLIPKRTFQIFIPLNSA